MSEQTHKVPGPDGLSEPVRQEIDTWLERYPQDRKQSAVLAALRAVQHENAYLSPDSMKAVAAYLGLPDIAVFEVGSFYSMFNIEPVGRHEISVCTNVSCMLRGADEIVAHLEDRLGVKLGGSTPDGKFFLKREEECLAACCGAPMMQINHVYHENLTLERVDQLLDELD